MADGAFLEPYAWLLPPECLPADCDDKRLPPSVRYIVINGGRGSGKSYNTADALTLQAHLRTGNILYTRYTMVAANVSIIPEFTDKIERHRLENAFDVKLSEITSKTTNATIYFRGIMQSSKNQTARLKSIPNVRVWVLDEAQELTDEEQFDTIDLSLRSVDFQNLVILILNPAQKRHWIYRRFFGERGIRWDYNGIDDRYPDTVYIHTDYTQNRAHLSQSFLDIAERTAAERPDQYRHVFLGEWRSDAAGLIYPGWTEIPASDYPAGLEQWWGLDWGYGGDPAALVRCCYDAVTGTVYIMERLYATGKLARDIAEVILADAATLIHHYTQDRDEFGNVGPKRPVYYRPGDCLVYCDPARPEGIGELRRIFGISAVPAINRDKTGRIGWMQGLRVKYVGAHIREEVESYCWMPDRYDSSRFTDTPQDGGDHIMDAANYAIFTHLHRTGRAGASTTIEAP